jgi:membrane fusion protein (multidrug efflux system)
LPLAGRIESIGSGTGAVFAILPAQNATGNWIKIVQRVPVRIRIDGSPDAEHPLPLGASLHVEVDTHDRRGPRLAAARPAGGLAQSMAYSGREAGAEAVVAETIAAAVAAAP